MELGSAKKRFAIVYPLPAIIKVNKELCFPDHFNRFNVWHLFHDVVTPIQAVAETPVYSICRATVSGTGWTNSNVSWSAKRQVLDVPETSVGVNSELASL